MENDKKECTKDMDNNNLVFSVAFKNDGESFQSVIEKILLNKINKMI